jgi:adenylate cyclase
VLGITLADGAQQNLGNPTTTDPEAYEEFLIGRQRFSRFFNEAENAQAREHFETALKLDPGFTQARAMLARTHAFDAMNDWGADREQSLRQALADARQALQQDDALPVAHFVRGLAFRELGDYPQAMSEADKALASDPSNANAHLLMATLLYRNGQPEAGLKHIETAIALNPHHPSNYSFRLGQMYYALSRYTEAIDAFRQGLEGNPASERLHLWLAASLAETGEIDAAKWEAEQILLENPGFSIAQAKDEFPYTQAVWVSRLLERLREVGLDR